MRERERERERERGGGGEREIEHHAVSSFQLRQPRVALPGLNHCLVTRSTCSAARVEPLFGD